MKNKFNLILNKFENLPKEKEVNFWEVGTDFILNIKRYNYLISKIYDVFRIKESSEIDLMVINPNVIGLKDNGQDVIAIKVEVYFVDKVRNSATGYFSIIRNKNEFRYLGDNKAIINISDLFAWSTYRQIMETWCSVGYITPQTKFAKGKDLDVLNVDSNLKEDNDVLRLVLEASKNTWDNISIKSNSIRDILFSIVITRFWLMEDESKNIDFDFIEGCMRNTTLTLRSKSKNIGFDELKEKIEKDSSSINKQTFHKNLDDEASFIIDEMFDFIFEKATKGWTVSDISSENAHLKYYINEQNRSGQGTYKLAMTNSLKRYNGDDYELHDIVDGVRTKKLVEAAHILDYRYCDENEKYDPENGLLIDPSLHKWFDKDLITFDENGNLLLHIEHHDEIKIILNDKLIYRIRENVLNEKTRIYIQRRNEQHDIEMEKFVRMN